MAELIESTELDTRIVAIEHQHPHTKNKLIIDWCLSNICNYTCTYCPPTTHAGTQPFVAVDKILNFSEQVVNHYGRDLGREICFLYTGGEVTIWDDFLTLIKAQKAAGNEIGISTNGSRPVRYWEEARKYLDHVSISFHSDHTSLDHFIRIINCVKHDVLTHVNIMVKPEYFDLCIKAAYEVMERTDEVTIDVQIVLENFQTPYEYTDAQRQKILDVQADISAGLKLVRERKPYRGLMKTRNARGEEELTKPGVILTKGQNRWKGWECHVGLELLVIDMHGNISRSWCGKTGQIGNIQDSKIEFPVGSYTCPADVCTGGITDVMTTKIAPEFSRV